MAEAAAVAVADAQPAAAVAQAQAPPMAQHAVIHEGMDEAMAATRAEQVAEPIQVSHLVTMLILHLGVMLISHPAMMPTSSRATTHNPPTMRHATSAHAHRKSAIARVVAVMVVGAAWVANVAKRHAHPPKVDNLTRCAPAWT